MCAGSVAVIMSAAIVAPTMATVIRPTVVVMVVVAVVGNGGSDDGGTDDGCGGHTGVNGLDGVAVGVVGRHAGSGEHRDERESSEFGEMGFHRFFGELHPLLTHLSREYSMGEAPKEAFSKRCPFLGWKDAGFSPYGSVR